jgi:signal transduction histidine kinase
MRPASLAGWTPRRLRLVLGLFVLALAIPAGLLIHQAFSHLKWAAFRQHQLLAEELAARIDTRLQELVRAEERRAIADYAFLVAEGDAPAGFRQRSPLSQLPVPQALPGLVGHFQVDAAGALTTPLLPPGDHPPGDLGMTPAELAERAARQARIRAILTENRLVESPPAVAPTAPPERSDRERPGLMAGAPGRAPEEAERPRPQAAFDRLAEPEVSAKAEKKTQTRGALGRVEDLRLDERFQQAVPPAPAAQEPMRRREAGEGGPPATASTAPRSAEGEAAAAAAPVSLFAREVGPFQLGRLGSGHVVLFRQVWRDGQRLIQGALIEQAALLQGVFEAAFRETLLSQTTDLVVAWQGDVLAAYPSQTARGYLTSAEELRGALLLRTRLSAPLEGMELLFSVAELPAGPGAALLRWLTAALLAVLGGGVVLMYRLGLRQIALVRQQQDFVSAVSHELKTPLTSIRMYGELLSAGWAAEEKRPVYYAFIHEESERLSRLIDNVLQLARLTRNDLRLDPRPVAVGELMEAIGAKVTSQIERAGFALRIDAGAEATAEAVVLVDTDAFTQILINLIDNALKFAARAEPKVVDVGCRLAERDTLVFWVRDYGPGVPRGEVRKIFRLFYRIDGGLTRASAGTGIGLALVRQLAEAMGGTVEVVNREPGAEFRVRLPRVP